MDFDRLKTSLVEAIEAGIDVTSLRGDDGKTLFHVAACMTRGNIKGSEVLIEQALNYSI